MAFPNVSVYGNDQTERVTVQCMEADSWECCDPWSQHKVICSISCFSEDKAKEGGETTERNPLETHITHNK